jgi:glycosyltransferase involved in cell wall biosynthesis
MRVESQNLPSGGHKQEAGARRALVFFPYLLKPSSGAQGVAAWIIHALQPDHEVTVLCWEADLDALNRRYGTAIDPRRVRIEIARPLPLLQLIPATVPGINHLRQWSRQRVARRQARHFDVVICANNEADLGGRGIQYVHDPSPMFRPRGGLDWGWYHARSPLGVVYFELGARLVGFSYERMRRNLTLVPSEWVRQWVRRVHDIDSMILHPPAAGVFPNVPWSERVNGFVWCGRLHPSKRVELVIDIVERVRRRGVPATLTLIGVFDNPRESYREHVLSLVAERAAWVTLHENVDRVELCRLMTAHRYGLHGTAEEYFGMAVAELVRAGTIVFVPRGGGQVEIVGGDDRFLFLAAEEAAEKIVRTMQDPALQDSLRATLAQMGHRFSPEWFVREFRRIVGVP